MPLPTPERAEEYARKGAELLLRRLGVAPEQRQAQRLARHAPPNGTGPVVTILSPRDWAAHVQYEAVIAQALRLRGARVEFLTCGGGLEICDRANTYESPPMPCTSCTRYVERSIDAHGFDRRAIRDGWDGEADGWDELDSMPAAALGSAEAEGLPLGNLTAIPLRWFLCAADLEADPLAGLTARALLRSARRIARGVARALDDQPPDVVLLLNGLFLFEGIAWALCRERGIDVVTYERAFRQGTLVFHRGPPAGYYDFSAEWERLARPLTREEDEELDRYLTTRARGEAFDQFWPFQAREVLPASGRLVTLFTNLTWDTAVLGRDLAFADIRDWVIAAVRAFEDRPEHRLVIRVHPSEQRLPGKRTRDSLSDYVRLAFPVLPPNVELVPADDLRSSYPLMAASDVGLVYSSTTGLELALMGVPVVVAAATHYRGKGFTLDAADPEDFLGLLDKALDDPDAVAPEVELARRYAHFFFFRAPLAAPAVVEPLPGLARITARDLSELAPGVNPSLDRICAGILEGTSFISDS